MKNTFSGGCFRLNGYIYYYVIKKYQGYIPGILKNGEFGV